MKKGWFSLCFFHCFVFQNGEIDSDRDSLPPLHSMPPPPPKPVTTHPDMMSGHAPPAGRKGQPGALSANLSELDILLQDLSSAQFMEVVDGRSSITGRVGGWGVGGVNWVRVVTDSLSLNALRPRQHDRHFADDIFRCIFLNENIKILIKISLKFIPKGPINNIAALVEMMAWHRPGDKPLSEPVIIILLTHICVYRSQSVNTLRPSEPGQYWFR